MWCSDRRLCCRPLVCSSSRLCSRTSGHRAHALAFSVVCVNARTQKEPRLFSVPPVSTCVLQVFWSSGESSDRYTTGPLISDHEMMTRLHDVTDLHVNVLLWWAELNIDRLDRLDRLPLSHGEVTAEKPVMLQRHGGDGKVTHRV